MLSRLRRGAHLAMLACLFTCSLLLGTTACEASELKQAQRNSNRFTGALAAAPTIVTALAEAGKITPAERDRHLDAFDQVQGDYADFNAKFQTLKSWDEGGRSLVADSFLRAGNTLARLQQAGAFHAADPEANTRLRSVVILSRGIMQVVGAFVGADAAAPAAASSAPHPRSAAAADLKAAERDVKKLEQLIPDRR